MQCMYKMFIDMPTDIVESLSDSEFIIILGIIFRPVKLLSVLVTGCMLSLLTDVDSNTLILRKFSCLTRTSDSLTTLPVKEAEVAL